MASITSAEEIPSVAVDGKPQGVQQQDASVIVSHASEQQDVAASIPVEPQVPLAAEQQALPELTGEKENAAAPVVVAADQSGPSDQVDQSNVSAAADEDLDETVVSLQELLLGGQGSPRVFTDEDGVSDITSNAVEAASVQDPSSIEVFEAEEVSVNEGVEVVEESISLEDLTEGSPEPTEPESTLSLAPEPVEPIEESISLEDLTEGTPEPTEPEASGSVASAKPVTSPAKPRTTSDSLSNAGPQPRKGLARNPSGKRNDKPRASNEGERPVSTREAKPVLGADGNPEVRKPAPAPYVNPNRVASGGLEKKKLSPEELDRKMEEMRLKNAEILRKKEAVAADAKAFDDAQKALKRREEEERRKKREEAVARKERDDHAKAAFNALNKEREENAARKAKAMAGREWDKDKEEAAFTSSAPRTGGRPRGPSYSRGRGRPESGRPESGKSLASPNWANEVPTESAPSSITATTPQS